MIVPVEDMIAAIKRGEMIILVDDEARENEGDLLLAANFVTPAAVNFMAAHARGLVCLTLTADHCQRLQLAMMKDENKSAYGTNFTVSIEAAIGVSTGISAHDRAKTIAAAAKPDAVAADLVSPGHVFPVRAEEGGVLVRAGHTEAGCDLANLAGLFPAAVICEIMKEDGSMARMDDLQVFAKHHKLKIGSIQSLIEHRLKTERLIKREKQMTVQTMVGEFSLTVFRDTIKKGLHLAFWRGDINPQKPFLTRVMVHPTLLDGMLKELPGRSWSVLSALERITAEDDGGALILLSAEEEKGAIAGQLEMLNGKAPSPVIGGLHTYGIGAQILKELGVGKVRLLSGKVKPPSMAGFGLQFEEMIEQ
ncbi:MAG: 3,4-dihydroxy-2-butanone-4-phosphate synthase [Candidatus Zeuxoniibacter abyssi]|nr:MAG: 3,4-dihydroxy-2-butanone-4-phosphate synthase [Candidatus Persebacteraceae bacterium AB1(2)]